MLYCTAERLVFSMRKKRDNEKMPRPAYGVGQNVWFMVRLAWTTGEKKVLVLNLLSALCLVGLELINLYISPSVLSAVERHASVGQLLGTIGAFVLALMVVSAAKEYVESNIQFGEVTVRMSIISLMNQKAAATSYPNLGDDDYQSLLLRAIQCTRNNASAAEAVWTTLRDLTANLLGFLLYARLLTAVEPVLLAVVLVTAAAGYALTSYLSSYGYRHREEAAEQEKRLEYLTGQAEHLGAAKDIRIFGLRPWLEELYDKAMGAYDAFHSRAEGVYLWGRIADLVLALVRSGAAYAYLIGQVLSGSISVAEFLLYFSAVGGFTQWVTGILTGFGTLRRQSMDLSTLREFLDFPEPFRFEGGESVEAAAEVPHELRLEHVSFRYPGAQRDTLHGVDLTLRPGEKLAVVGLNGAGKTTLVKLLCGFLDPTEGRVLLDGRDVRTLDRRQYYALFSAVFQDFSLLAGTVAVNVAQRETGIDMARVRACVEKAGLRERIEALPAGYDTMLDRTVHEDAVLLSGGETQRLMLARALYKDAPFVILDEPTAALDPIAEAELYQKYNEMTQGRSSVYISHRLASTRFCDRIIMLGGGGICQEGTHEELLRRGGEYAALYEVQSQYYQEGETDHA